MSDKKRVFTFTDPDGQKESVEVVERAPDRPKGRVYTISNPDALAQDLAACGASEEEQESVRKMLSLPMTRVQIAEAAGIVSRLASQRHHHQKLEEQHPARQSLRTADEIVENRRKELEG